MSQPPSDLLNLGKRLAQGGHVILGEGNVSCCDNDESMWISASGSRLDSSGESDFVQVQIDKVLNLLESGKDDDEEIRTLLNSCRTDGMAKAVPSTEAFMHAVLMRMPGVKYIAHCHPPKQLALASTRDAETLCKRRLFPDHIVVCGHTSIWVPYEHPGLALALAVRDAVKVHVEKTGENSKCIWLGNHGLIGLGATAREAEAICSMSEKAAGIVLDMLQSGLQPRWMSDEEIGAIVGWPDEHYRHHKLFED